MNSAKSVCVVVPDITGQGGGVRTLAAFIFDTLRRSGRYEPSMVSLAVSSKDEASVRLLSPKSWRVGPNAISRNWRGIAHEHVGCYLAEFEFQRYRCRHPLTEILNQYDVVHVVAGHPSWALVTRGCKGAVFLHAATFAASERSGMRRFAFPRWRYWMTRVTDRLDVEALNHIRAAFAMNVGMEQRLGRAMGASRVAFALPGVDTQLFRPNYYREGGYILSVGRFSDPRKNVRMLLRAYGILRRAVVDAPKLVLAGLDTLSHEDWEFASRLDIVGHVETRQDLSPEELAELYRGACMFVLSSDEEGLGLVILEAMACGLPVLSTRCGGPEGLVVEDVTGYLTPIGDAHAFAGKMKGLLDDVLLRRNMAERSRRIAEEKFSLDTAGRAIIEKYDEFLSGGG
jgi:glycosyltransferase involved in cell wall biosynthesis